MTNKTKSYSIFYTSWKQTAQKYCKSIILWAVSWVSKSNHKLHDKYFDLLEMVCYCQIMHNPYRLTLGVHWNPL